MMYLRLARQQRIDHVTAEPGREISTSVVGNHGDAAGCGRYKPLRRREPHQYLSVVDRSRALDTEAVAVE
jgi:hypothetical protein